MSGTALTCCATHCRCASDNCFCALAHCGNRATEPRSRFRRNIFFTKGCPTEHEAAIAATVPPPFS